MVHETINDGDGIVLFRTGEQAAAEHGVFIEWTPHGVVWWRRASQSVEFIHERDLSTLAKIPPPY